MSLGILNDFYLVGSVMADSKVIESVYKQINTGDYDGALKRANALLSKNMEDSELMYIVSECLQRKGDYKKAMKVAEYLCKVHGNDGASWYVRGSCYLCMGKYDDAAKYLRKSLSLHDNDEAMRMLGIATFYGSKKNAYKQGIQILENLYASVCDRKFDALLMMSLMEVHLVYGLSQEDFNDDGGERIWKLYKKHKDKGDFIDTMDMDLQEVHNGIVAMRDVAKLVLAHKRLGFDAKMYVRADGVGMSISEEDIEKVEKILGGSYEDVLLDMHKPGQEK